ncbi:hypothetical protein CDAR_291991 [Caerostris darwini]|uniref:Uncharacterized protein n=1 Tax=Caerostris darwini TaxID=1538125 RepID=A0AAV4WX20_9ARAC|nr:hypothetical protein CDAR_291991 [Caerostris darwini]
MPHTAATIGNIPFKGPLPYLKSESLPDNGRSLNHKIFFFNDMRFLLSATIGNIPFKCVLPYLKSESLPDNGPGRNHKVDARILNQMRCIYSPLDFNEIRSMWPRRMWYTKAELSCGDGPCETGINIQCASVPGVWCSELTTLPVLASLRRMLNLPPLQAGMSCE